jgi:hypothetical protein
MTDSDARLHDLLDTYLAGAVGSRLRHAFGNWARTLEDRRGVVVALDESGRVVAAMDTLAPLDSRSSPPDRAPLRTHAHGWAPVGGAWTCVQDYHADGEAPETGCGQVYD